MGQSIASLTDRFSNKKQLKVLIDGLDDAGKTTILYRWILGETINTIHTIECCLVTNMPGIWNTLTVATGSFAMGSFLESMGESYIMLISVGCNVETLDYNNFQFTFWDFASSDRLRPLRRHYYPGVKVAIFVVDSTDTERFSEVKEEFTKMVQSDELSDAIFLLFANKQDLPNAVTAAALSEILDLYSLKNKRWLIQASCARSGDGLYEGLDWVCNELSKTSTIQ